MILQKNKTYLIVVLVSMLAATTIMINTSTTNASIVEYDMYAVVMLSPETVGVNQQMLVSMRLDKMGVGTTIRANLFTGYKVTITKPDGTTESKGPYTADATSGAWFTYTPTQVGTYTFQMTFPGQWINTTAIQRWYKPATSAPVSLTVQQDPIMPYPDVPLPADYWQRPIYGENKGWWQIADNWLMGARGRYDPRFAEYTSAPDSGHILWKKPIWFGGMGGGQFGDKVYYSGLSYEQPYEPTILEGRIIYIEHGPTSTTAFGTRCISLYTGENIWYLPDVSINFAQVLDVETANEHGLLSYLWSTGGSGSNGTWRMYDGFTGNYLLTITNVTSNRNTFGPNGEILSYSFSGTTANRRLICWNSTKAIMNDPANRGGSVDYFSPTYGSVVDGNRGIEWNVSVPNVGVSQSILAMGEGYLLARFTNSSSYPQIFTDMAYDLSQMKKDSSGTYPTQLSHLWLKNRTDLFTNSQRAININSGVYTFFSGDQARIHCYSIKTGEELWVSDPLPGWGLFDVLSITAYGKVCYTGYSGHVRAFDAQTGELAWDYYLGNAGFENAYGTYAVNNALTAADGKIFATSDEHTPDSVMWRGGKLWCIDAETGEGLWNISGWTRLVAISDGILTAVNAYDNQIYTIGKGPSKTTVTAPQTQINLGEKVMLTGTVTDQSPGAKDTPAVSDESMYAWMSYLHMQKPKPTDVTGVTVKLTAVDPNGNTQTIGDTTTDVYGNYGLSWEPPIEGSYQIIATFEGTNSYGSSAASTYIVVDSETTTTPTSTPTATTTPTSTATPTSSPAVPPGGPAISTEAMLAIVAVVIVAVAVAAVVLFRRRK